MNFVRWLPQFRAADRALAEFAAREQWSRSDLAGLQLERVNRLWQEATAHVPYYADLQRTRRLDREFSNLEDFQAQVPRLTKHDLRREGRRLLSERAPPGSWSRSSGSTGVPTLSYWGHAAKREMLAAKYCFYAAWNIDYFDRCVFVWGSPAPPQQSWISRPYHDLKRWASDRLRNRLRLSHRRVTTAVLRRHLGRIAAFRPTLMYSATSCAYLLAQEAKASGFCCPELKLVNYTAEPGLPRLVRAMEEGFGVPAIGEYGSTECGFLAGEDRTRRLRVRDDIALLETLPRPDGRYDIVVTPLTNSAFPLLRYELGDVTTAPLAQPERGLSILGDVAGRMNDFLVTRTGSWLNSDLVEAPFEERAWVRRFAVRQALHGAVTAHVETLATPPAAAVAALQQHLALLLEGYPVEVRLHTELPPHASGKHRWITSDMITPASFGAAEQAVCALTQ